MRLQNLVPSREDVGDDFLGGSFSCRAGHADQRFAPYQPDGFRELLKRVQSIVDYNQGRVRSVSRDLVAAHNRSNGSLGQRFADEVVPVDTLTQDCKEQLARLDGARVDGITDSDSFRIECTARLEELGDARQAELHDWSRCAIAYPACTRAWRATSKSSKETTPWLVSWYFS